MNYRLLFKVFYWFILIVLVVFLLSLVVGDTFAFEDALSFLFFKGS